MDKLFAVSEEKSKLENEKIEDTQQKAVLIKAQSQPIIAPDLPLNMVTKCVNNIPAKPHDARNACETCQSTFRCKELVDYNYSFIGGRAFDGDCSQQRTFADHLKKKDIRVSRVWKQMRGDYVKEHRQVKISSGLVTPPIRENSMICISCMNAVWFDMLKCYKSDYLL